MNGYDLRNIKNYEFKGNQKSMQAAKAPEASEILVDYSGSRNILRKSTIKEITKNSSIGEPKFMHIGGTTNQFSVWAVSYKGYKSNPVEDLVVPRNFTRIGNDTDGNPNYVIHYLHFQKPGERLTYEDALKRAKKIGGGKFHNKQYGGGIKFQSYSLEETAKRINELLGYSGKGYKSNPVMKTKGARKSIVRKKPIKAKASARPKKVKAGAVIVGLNRITRDKKYSNFLFYNGRDSKAAWEKSITKAAIMPSIAKARLVSKTLMKDLPAGVVLAVVSRNALPATIENVFAKGGYTKK